MLPTFHLTAGLNQVTKIVQGVFFPKSHHFFFQTRIQVNSSGKHIVPLTKTVHLTVHPLDPEVLNGTGL